MISTFPLRGLRTILVVTVPLVTLLPACSAEVVPRGNLPNAASLERVVPGETTRAQVSSLLGTPSSTSLFEDQETWFYIGAKTTQYAFYPTEEVDRKVVAVTFDGNGVVKEVRALDQEDGVPVKIVERKTPTVGNELTIIQQMLGNLGRFNKPPEE